MKSQKEDDHKDTAKKEDTNKHKTSEKKIGSEDVFLEKISKQIQSIQEIQQKQQDQISSLLNVQSNSAPDWVKLLIPLIQKH